MQKSLKGKGSGGMIGKFLWWPGHLVEQPRWPEGEHIYIYLQQNELGLK
jgi:hypothetical protein